MYNMHVCAECIVHCIQKIKNEHTWFKLFSRATLSFPQYKHTFSSGTSHIYFFHGTGWAVSEVKEAKLLFIKYFLWVLYYLLDWVLYCRLPHYRLRQHFSHNFFFHLSSRCNSTLDHNVHVSVLLHIVCVLCYLPVKRKTRHLQQCNVCSRYTIYC